MSSILNVDKELDLSLLALIHNSSNSESKSSQKDEVKDNSKVPKTEKKKLVKS